MCSSSSSLLIVSGRLAQEFSFPNKVEEDHIIRDRDQATTGILNILKKNESQTKFAASVIFLVWKGNEKLKCVIETTNQNE